ncbi:g4989 [Coccomyxa elongata]
MIGRLLSDEGGLAASYALHLRCLEGDSTMCKAGMQQDGGADLTGLSAQEVSSDSEPSDSGSDCVVDIDEEEVAKLGDGIWVHEGFLAYLSKLVATKLTFIDEKRKEDIKMIPRDPRRKRAWAIRNGWCDGCYDEADKAYFDDYAKDSSAVEWRTIQV